MLQIIWNLLIATVAIAAAQTLAAVGGTLVLWRHARRSTRVGAKADPPPAVVFMACKGVEDRLGDTIRALDAQTHRNYRVCIAFESERDPAVAFVRQTIAAIGSDRFDLVFATRAVDRSQKIENLLAAIEHVGDAAADYAFTDSDAVPPPDWLCNLVAPLSEARVGATTGFRWYARDGSTLGLVRCLWNALGLNWFNTPFVLMCWGGSMAMRRETFERLDVRRAWSGSISDDLAIATVVRRAKLVIRFVPSCVIPCHEQTTWGAFLRFARRQLVITRVCAPSIWQMATMIMLIFAAALTMCCVSVAAGVLKGDSTLALAGSSAFALLVLANVPRAMLLHGAVAPFLPPSDRQRDSGVLDGVALPFMVVFNAALMLAASISNRINWRGIRYELRSPNETIRLDALPHPSIAEPADAVTPDVDTQRA
jgi:cellulose synthase/poly-beta-1,6-N-acetylglucosamine synthase-like glycosyltransferase